MIEMHPKDPIMLRLQKTMGNLVPNFSDQMGNKEESERGSMWPVWVFEISILFNIVDR